jgi:hypothetical protein
VDALLAPRLCLFDDEAGYVDDRGLPPRFILLELRQLLGVAFPLGCRTGLDRAACIAAGMRRRLRVWTDKKGSFA